MSAYTGTLPTLLAGKMAPATDWTEILNALHALADPWTAWTPTLTNLTLGNGTVTARYRQVGKTVDYRFKFVLGSTSAVGTDPTFTLPATPHPSYAVFLDALGTAELADAGIANRRGVVWWNVSAAAVYALNTTGVQVSVTATVPHTWGTSDAITAAGTYEVA